MICCCFSEKYLENPVSLNESDLTWLWLTNYALLKRWGGLYLFQWVPIFVLPKYLCDFGQILTLWVMLQKEKMLHCFFILFTYEQRIGLKSGWSLNKRNVQSKRCDANTRGWL